MKMARSLHKLLGHKGFKTLFYILVLHFHPKEISTPSPPHAPHFGSSSGDVYLPFSVNWGILGMRQGQSHLPPKLRHCGME